MNRSQAIATTIAGAGILTAVMVAGVAVVNATDTDQAQPETTLVVASEPVAPAPSLAAQELPTVELPSDAPQATSITRNAARAAVLAAAPGEIVKTWVASRGGFDAFAVQVLRPDGSVVNGFVDRTSGVVFDWAEVSGPTATSTYQDDDDDHDDHDDDDHEDDDDHDESYDDDDD